MKQTIKHLASAMAVAFFLFIAFGSDDEENTESSSSPVEKTKSSSSPDGTYTSTVSGGGPGGQFSVSIYGDSWSSVLKLNSYDNGDYSYGSVRGKDLYDESGYVKVGYVSGNTVTIGRFSASK
jgi:photosystem II stability/assembly factor-like uncharacterized protein